MKLSKTVHWILAVLASVTVFVVEILAGKNGMLHSFEHDSGQVVLVIVPVLIGIMVAPLNRLQGRRFITFIAILFILSCFFPPWQYTADRNGNDGFHTRTPAGHYFIFDPPPTQFPGFGKREHYGVQLDLARLFVEWAALAGITGLVWMLFGRPAWPRDDKADPSQKFSPPTGNPKN